MSTIDASISHVFPFGFWSRLYYLFQIYDSWFMIHNFYKFPRFSFDYRLEKSTFSGTDDRRTTCHRLDRRHTEVLIDRDIDARSRSLDEQDERIIIRWLKSYNIFLSMNFSEDLIFHGIVFPVAKYQILIRHIEKSIDDDIDTLRGWEASPRKIVISNQ